MWIFLDENLGLTPLEKSDFSTFEKFLFLYSQILSFSSKTLFLGSFCPKKSERKCGFFLRKSWVNPFEKMSF